MTLARLVLVPIVLSGVAGLWIRGDTTTTTLEYTIRYRPEPDPATLTVRLIATGLPASGGRVSAQLENWGEWTSAPYPYLRNLRVDGREVAYDRSGVFAVPATALADGRLEVRYDLVVQRHGTPEHQARPLLPYRGDHHVLAFTSNTLVGLAVDGVPAPARVTVRLEAAADQSVFSGWAGLSAGPQSGAAPATLSAGNGLFAIGTSFGHTAAEVDGTVLEVAQFAAGPDVTGAIAEVARAVIASATRATGRGPRNPVRIFVEDRPGGGTHTDLGLVIHHPGGLPLSDPATELLAHELLHEWLGSQLVGDESLTWFMEGFTTYLALWHATSGGPLSPGRFGERILEVERQARASASWGRRTFAEPGVDWRDDDGPNETMAYRGGALLAFVVDVELRRRSGRTVSALVRGLLESAPRDFELTHVRDAMTQLGLADLYDRSIAGTHMPDALPLLLSLGYEQATESAALTYLGIEARYDGPAGSDDVVPAVVTAVDSAGPAAAAGVRPGDRIVGFGARRGNPPALGPDAPARYRFGLSVIPSGARSVPLEVSRAGAAVRIEVAPVLVRGGQRPVLRWNADRRSGFFDPPPP